MERVQEELLCFSTILRTIAHSVRSQFGALESSAHFSRSASNKARNKTGKNENDRGNDDDESAKRDRPKDYGGHTNNTNHNHNKRTTEFLSPGDDDQRQHQDLRDGGRHKHPKNDNNDDDDDDDREQQQHALSLDETIELLDLAGQLLESDNNSYRIRALLLETRPNLVEVLVGILASNPLSVLPPSAVAAAYNSNSSNNNNNNNNMNNNNNNNNNNSSALSRSASASAAANGALGSGGTGTRRDSGALPNLHLVGAASLRHDHEQVQRRFASLQWKAMSNLARACALAAPTEATASQFGFVLDSFEVLNIALRYLVMDEAGLSLRTCAAEVLFLCVTKLQLEERAAQSNETVDAIVFQLAESDHNTGGSAVIGGRSTSSRFDSSGSAGTEDTLRCYLVGTLHAIGPVERLLSADFVDVAIGILRDGPIYACTKILDLMSRLFKRNPYFVPSSLPMDRVLLLCETLGSVLSRLGDHAEVVVAACRVIEICAIVSALAVEDEAIVQSDEQRQRKEARVHHAHHVHPFGSSPSSSSAAAAAAGASAPSLRRNTNPFSNNTSEEGPGRFLVFFCHEGQHGPWRKLLIAGKTDPSLVEARAYQMRAMRILIQCIIDPHTMRRLADELGRDLPLFSALLSAPLRLPPFHDERGHHYVCEASLCLTFLMAKVPSFRANVRRAAATFPAWLQNLEQRLVEGMEAGLQNARHEVASMQLVDVCGNLLNSTGFVDRFSPRAWADVNALEACVSRLFEFQLKVDPHEPRPPLSNSSAAADNSNDGAPFVAVFVDMDRKSMVLTTGVLAYAICLSFQEIINDKKYYDQSEDVARFLDHDHEPQAENQRIFGTDPNLLSASSFQHQSGAGAGGRGRSQSRSQSHLQHQLVLLQQQQQEQNQTSATEPNFVATDDVEVRTEISEATSASEPPQSNLLLQDYASVRVGGGTATKPSPYSLHAIKSRTSGSELQQHGSNLPQSSISAAAASSSKTNRNNSNSNVPLAFAASPVSAFQRTSSKNSNNTNMSVIHSLSGAGGFVQRNSVGRFEPVEVIDSNTSRNTNVGGGGGVGDHHHHHHNSMPLSSVLLKRQPSNARSGTSSSRSNSAQRPQSGSRSSGNNHSNNRDHRANTPTKTGPLVVNSRMWK